MDIKELMYGTVKWTDVGSWPIIFNIITELAAP